MAGELGVRVGMAGTLQAARRHVLDWRLDIPPMMTHPLSRFFHVWVIRDASERVTRPVFGDTHRCVTR